MFRNNIFLCLIVLTVGSSADEPLQEFSKGSTKFVSDLIKVASKANSGDNVVISPLSAEIILALTADGAKGQTYEELRQGLSLPNKERTTSAVKSLLNILNQNSENFKVSVANKLYISKKFKINENFQKVAVSAYKSGVQNVDFGESKKTAALINQWVENNTNHKIQNLISSDQLKSNTALVLVNTLYLKGKWKTPFAAHKTIKQPFYGSSGKVKNVEIMHSSDTASYLYFHCGYFKAKFLEIPYQDSSVSMTFVLPDAKDGLSKVEEDLEPYLKPRNLTRQRVAVSLPKFSTTTSHDFKNYLTKMGVTKIFNKEADLSGISSNGRGLYIDFIQQKVFINITEIGTEAAAATGVGGGPNIIVQPPKLTFNADHPFLYFIRETKSNVILFIGRYR